MSRRVVLLGRVSRGERQQDPENQLGPLRKLAQRHGWEVVEEIALHQSAWTEKSAAEVRARVLAPIIDGRADTLAVWALDRVVRGGVVDALSFIGRLESHYKAAFFSLQEPMLSTATADRQMRELLVSVLSWVAKWESERRSQRLKAKAERKRSRAEAIGQNARWGRGVIASHAQVARVHELRARGLSIRAIAADEQVRLSKSQVQRIVADTAPGEAVEGASS